MTYESKRTNNAHANTRYMFFPLYAPCILRSCQTSQIGLCFFSARSQKYGPPIAKKRLGTPHPRVPTANESLPTPPNTRHSDRAGPYHFCTTKRFKFNITVRRTACISNDWCLPLFSAALSRADMEPYKTTKQIMLSEF